MLILYGRSASGKTEVAKNLIKCYGFNKIITYTTRAIRPNEENHVDYHFLTVDEFNKLKDDNFFFETVEYNHNFYGTANADLTINKVVILEPNGVEFYVNNCKELKYIVYLKCCDKTAKSRMLLRKDNLDVIDKRIKLDAEVFSSKNEVFADFVVDTNELSIDEISSIILKGYNQLINER